MVNLMAIPTHLPQNLRTGLNSNGASIAVRACMGVLYFVEWKRGDDGRTSIVTRVIGKHIGKHRKMELEAEPDAKAMIGTIQVRNTTYNYVEVAPEEAARVILALNANPVAMRVQPKVDEPTTRA